MTDKKQRGFGHSRRRIAVELGILAGGLIALVLLALWLASALAGWLVGFIPVSADEAVGESAWEQLAPTERRCAAPETQAYVDGLMEPLIAELRDDRFSFRIVVVEDDAVNAFALPGGFVAVNTGLLEAAESGEEIAGVLAHEIHHVTERHGMTRVLRTAGGRIILSLVFGVDDFAALVQYAGALADLSYDRDQEREADDKGRALLMRAGIDPGGMATFFSRLEAEMGANIPTLLSSHPGNEERSQAAERDAAGFTPDRALPPPPSPVRCR